MEKVISWSRTNNLSLYTFLTKIPFLENEEIVDEIDEEDFIIEDWLRIWIYNYINRIVNVNFKEKTSSPEINELASRLSALEQSEDDLKIPLASRLSFSQAKNILLYGGLKPLFTLEDYKKYDLIDSLIEMRSMELEASNKSSLSYIHSFSENRETFRYFLRNIENIKRKFASLQTSPELQHVSGINSFPNQIFNMITGTLEMKEIGRMRTVSKKWKEIKPHFVNLDFTNECFNNSDLEKILSGIMISGTESIKLTSMNQITDESLRIIGDLFSKSKRLRKITLHENISITHIGINYLSSIPSLRKLDIRRPVDHTFPESIPKMRLSFLSMDIYDTDVHKLSKNEVLSSITLKIYSMEENPNINLIFTNFSSLWELKTLVLLCDKVDLYELRGIDSLTNLESLSLDFSVDIEGYNEISNIVTLKHLSVFDLDFYEVGSEPFMSEMRNLTSLNIDTDVNSYSKWIQVINRNTILRNLEIKTDDIYDDLLDSIRYHPLLKKLTIDYDISHAKIDKLRGLEIESLTIGFIDEKEISFLQYLPKLKTLVINGNFASLPPLSKTLKSLSIKNNLFKDIETIPIQVSKLSINVGSEEMFPASINFEYLKSLSHLQTLDLSPRYRGSIPDGLSPLIQISYF